MTDEVRRLVAFQANRAVLPDASADHPGMFVGHREGTVSADTLAECFARELVAVGGDVHHAADPVGAANVVLDLLGKIGAKLVLAWDSAAIACPGLIERLTAAGVRLAPQAMPADARSRLQWLEELEAVPVGLTAADAGLGDTGSIVLVSGRGCGRMASLLPPVHVAVLRRDRLFGSLQLLIRAEPHLLVRGSNAVIITGPSRTGDIEVTLSRGVHGPGEVHVVLVGETRL